MNVTYPLAPRVSNSDQLVVFELLYINKKEEKVKKGEANIVHFVLVSYFAI